MEQARFIFSPLGKAFEKQTKTSEDQEEKQIKAIQNQEQIKTTKNMLVMTKIMHWSQNKKKYLINL